MEINLNQVTKLEPFLLMAKSMKGAGAAKLVQDATSAPGVFVFSELLEMQNVQDLKNSEQHAPFYNLLEFFAYKTYQDYLDHKDTLPPLNAAQITKLKHLTIVTMASERRIIPYTSLLAALHISSIRELEDLIIDAIYLSLITGRLSHSSSHLEITSTTARDIHPTTGIQSILYALQDWARTTGEVIAALDAKIDEMAVVQGRERERRERHEARIGEVVRELGEKKNSAGGGADGGKPGVGKRVRDPVTGHFMGAKYGGEILTRGGPEMAGSMDMMDVDEPGVGEGRSKNRKSPFFDMGTKEKRKRKNP